jgi:hypothetical protein
VTLSNVQAQYAYDGRDHNLQVPSLTLAQGQYQLQARLQGAAPMALQVDVTGQVNAPTPGSPAGGLLERVNDHVDSATLDHLARAGAEQALRQRPIYRLDAARSENEARAIRHLRALHVRNDALLIEVGLKP